MIFFLSIRKSGISLTLAYPSPTTKIKMTLSAIEVALPAQTTVGNYFYNYAGTDVPIYGIRTRP